MNNSKIVVLFLVFFSILFLNTGAKKAPKYPTEVFSATVLSVIDGDTIDVTKTLDKSKLRIRVLKIDCPESKPNKRCKTLHKENCKNMVPLGLKAKEEAKLLLPVGSEITVMAKGKDLYQRTLGTITLLDGRDFADIMLTKGCSVYK